MDIQRIQHHLLEKAFFPHCIAMMNLVTLNIGSLSGSSAMFYLFVYSHTNTSLF